MGPDAIRLRSSQEEMQESSLPVSLQGKSVRRHSKKAAVREEENSPDREPSPAGILI